VPRVVAVTKIVFIGSLAFEELRVKLSLPREVTTGPGEFRERSRQIHQRSLAGYLVEVCEAGASALVKARSDTNKILLPSGDDARPLLLAEKAVSVCVCLNSV
jgi:hypothetical protein